MNHKPGILCNKNTEVMEVVLENGKIIEIGEVFAYDFLPLSLQNELTLESVNKWLDKRKMPLNRDGLKRAKEAFDSSIYQNYNHMFSLTDQYWFKLNKSDSWSKLNFFTNEYSSEIGQSLFTPWTTNKEKMQKENPDLTTNGVLKKVWVQDKDTLESYLIKTGSKKFAQEPLSEVLATMTLRKMKGFIPFVEYDLCVNGMRICSKCKNFVDENTEFIPAQSVYNIKRRNEHDTKFTHLIKMLEEYGLKRPINFVDRMLFVDCVVGNNDRHLGNFGVLKNVEKNEIIGFAPLFDFGSAFHEYNVRDNSKDKPRLFQEEIERIKRTYGRMSDLKGLAENDDLFLVIDTYPDLTFEQKRLIKDGIIERTKQFNLSDQVRGGARSR